MKKLAASSKKSSTVQPSMVQLSYEDAYQMLDFIKPNKNMIDAVATATTDRIKRGHAKHMKGLYIYKEIIPILKKEMERLYYRALLSPGEMVGVSGSTYLAEIITQLTLNTFHFTGLSLFSISNTGTPRLKELMKCTKKEKIDFPTMSLFFDETIIKKGMDRMSALKAIFEFSKSNIEEVLLQSLLVKDEEGDRKIHDVQKNRKLTEDEEDLYEIHFMFSSDDAQLDRKRASKYEWSIRLHFDKTRLLERKITLHQICKKIEIFRDLYCIPSPLHLAYIDVYIDTSMIEIPKNASHITEENKDLLFIDTIVKVYLYDLQVAGIEGIEKVYFVPNGDKWITGTIGTNFQSIIALEGIDYTKCIPNALDEAKILGIEAQRSILIMELKKVVPGINSCHIEILADSMTHSGTLTSVSRYGIDKVETGPLTRASFEESYTTLTKSAVKQEEEHIRGVSSCVMTGQMGKYGTGMFDLMLDNKAIERGPVYEQTPAMFDHLLDKNLLKVSESKAIPDRENDPINIRDIMEKHKKQEKKFKELKTEKRQAKSPRAKSPLSDRDSNDDLLKMLGYGVSVEKKRTKLTKPDRLFDKEFNSSDDEISITPPKKKITKPPIKFAKASSLKKVDSVSIARIGKVVERDSKMTEEMNDFSIGMMG